MSAIVIFLFAFFLGTIPFRVIFVRFLAPQKAILVSFVFDLLKGALPIVLITVPGLQSAREALAKFADGTFFGVSSEGHPLFLHLTALFVYLGHCFSPWVSFRGGRGVATALGCLLVISPAASIAGILGFLLSFLSNRIVSLATLVGAALAAVAYLIVEPTGMELGVDVVFLLLFLSRHESSIDALLDDREKPFVWKRR
ncbi:glycerol-3-phosphate acyltransferase [Bdellovibrionota bacterium FG-2]